MDLKDLEFARGWSVASGPTPTSLLSTDMFVWERDRGARYGVYLRLTIALTDCKAMVTIVI